MTFLVNWWDKKPIAPYCMDISDDVALNSIRAIALRGGMLSSILGGGGAAEKLWAELQAAVAAGTIGPVRRALLY